ncbi:S8 family serine peptidase [Halonotius roseus]|uniref:Uncharacterized protein n=1 Tax=Halonotius roseus TaxID=2511997 RepID=A0A544QRH3_9EURY|nr:S8 family serine peptidase [Halonotius roseus]TQQ82046.1 hypothetical protein EWF95_03650 [Halonotius roseus]
MVTRYTRELLTLLQVLHNIFISSHTKINERMICRRRLISGVLFFSIVLVLITTIGTVGAAPSSTAVVDTDNSSSTPIDPALHSATGHVEVVVRLSETERLQIAQSDTPIDTLQTNANHTQKPVIDYAERTDGITIKDRFWVTNAVLLEVDTNAVDLEDVRSITGVKRLHKNFKIEVGDTQSVSSTNYTTTMSPATISSDATDTYTYGLEQINATSTWRRFGSRGEGVRIAVLDTGVDATNHSDLTPATGGWKDFVTNQPEPYDDNGHGSHVSGTIVGEQTPTGIYYGVAPEAELFHGKVFADDGQGDFATLLDGLEWSIDNEADIISLSLGADGYYHNLIDPVQTANAAGSVVIASVGNDGSGTSSSPGNYYNTINVGATTESKTVWSGSGGEEISTADVWGTNAPASWPDTYIVPTVTAPGENVVSTYSEGRYAEISGTSMAAPHVTGTVALMQSATDESLTPTEIEAALVDSAWKPDGSSTDRDTQYGSGIIDAYHATATVTDTAEADLTLDSAMTNTDTAVVGESVVTEISVINRGDATGTFVASLQINGTLTQAKSVDVAPGETEQLSFVSEFDTSGNYVITVNGEPAGTVTVLEPANFNISAVDLNPATVSSGESSELTARVENTGGVAGTQELVATITGEASIEPLRRSISLGAGETESVSFDVPTASMAPETYTVTVASNNDSRSAELTVRDSPSITAERTVSDATVSPGDQTTVSVEIDSDRSIDDLRVRESIIPSAAALSATNDPTAVVIEESESNDEVFASWQGTDSATLQYVVTVPDTGSSTLELFGTVTDTDDTTVTVQGDSQITVETTVATYAGTNGRIGPQGLGDAAADFRNGEIGTQLLGDVAAAFRTYEKVM